MNSDTTSSVFAHRLVKPLEWASWWRQSEMTEADILGFVRGAITSTWELELLLLLYRDPEKRWSAEELNRELRASQEVVVRAVRGLRTHGLVVESGDRFGYPVAGGIRDDVMDGLRQRS